MMINSTIRTAIPKSIRKFAAGLMLSILAVLPVQGAGTLPFALQQQFSFTNCQTGTNACGTPLIGGLLFFFQAGTVATRQDSFQDTALTIVNPWPLPLDANGRVPMFYLADGSIHIRLTDSGGVVQYDNTVLVIGPSSGGGGGSTVDPTTIMATGDIKFRPTGETLSGWVRLNGLTIGSAASGATNRANADTQNLFVYLWNNCSNAHCPVLTGRGVSGLADFNANKQLTLLDMRSRALVGLDDMGATGAGRMQPSNVTSGGGDTVTTPAGTGGEANHTLTVAEMPAHSHTINDPGHTHSTNPAAPGVLGPGAGQAFAAGGTAQSTLTILTSLTGITINNTGGGSAANNMMPFMMGSWHQKL